MSRDTKLETAIQLFAEQRHILQIGQEDTLRPVVGVAYIVTGQAALAGQFADARHAVSFDQYNKNRARTRCSIPGKAGA